MKTRRLLPLLAAAVLPLCAIQSGLAAGTRDSPLDRRLRLNLWGAGLRDVAIAVKEATGVDIVFYLPDLPAGENTDNVYLVTGEVPLSTVLETLARRYGFRFRLALTEQGEQGERGERIELSRGYGWASPDADLRFVRMHCLSARGCAPETEREFLSELLKPLPLLSSDFTVNIEPYPLPGRQDSLRASVALPKELAEYFVRAVECLSGDDGDYPSYADLALLGGDITREQAGMYATPGRPRNRDHLTARARGETPPDWEALLTQPVRLPEGSGLRSVLAGIAEQTGSAIALRAPPPEAERGAFPPDTHRFTFGQICGMLSENFRLGKCVFLSSGGVVFERGGDTAPETDPRSREFFWSGLAVAGFDAKEAVERAGGLEAFLSLVRREVFPGVWRDPVCSILYSPATERLAVVAPYNVVEKLAATMAGIR